MGIWIIYLLNLVELKEVVNLKASINKVLTQRKITDKLKELTQAGIWDKVTMRVKHCAINTHSYALEISLSLAPPQIKNNVQ